MKIAFILLLVVLVACQTTGTLTVYTCENGRIGETVGSLNYGSEVQSDGVFVPGCGYAVRTPALTGKVYKDVPVLDGFVYSLENLKVVTK